MSYRIRFHPAVTDDLNAITCWLIDYAGPQSAARRLDEIEATIASLTDLPQKGNCRDESAPELRAVPAGRKAVVAFTVDDEAREMHAHAVTYAGADWIRRRKARGRKCTPRAANETSATKQPSAVVQSSRPNQIEIS